MHPYDFIRELLIGILSGLLSYLILQMLVW